MADLGSTFLGILERYSDSLKAHDSRLMLTGLSEFLLNVIKQTGQIETFGRENVFKATDEVGESVFEAYREADEWVAANLESEAADDVEENDGNS